MPLKLTHKPDNIIFAPSVLLRASKCIHKEGILEIHRIGSSLEFVTRIYGTGKDCKSGKHIGLP